MRRDAAAAGELVARASSPAGSGGVPPRERNLNLRVLAAGRCGNPPPGRLRHGGQSSCAHNQRAYAGHCPQC